MKTKTFIEKVEELGFRAEESDSGIDVINEISKYVCRVSKKIRFALDTDWTAFKKTGEATREDLYKLAVEYANTPLVEREEEKKYYVKLKNEVLAYNMHGSHLNFSKVDERYLFSNQESTRYYTSIFTQKEINEFPDEVKELLPLCKQIEVTP